MAIFQDLKCMKMQMYNVEIQFKIARVQKSKQISLYFCCDVHNYIMYHLIKH